MRSVRHRLAHPPGRVRPQAADRAGPRVRLPGGRRRHPGHRASRSATGWRWTRPCTATSAVTAVRATTTSANAGPRSVSRRRGRGAVRGRAGGQLRTAARTRPHPGRGTGGAVVLRGPGLRRPAVPPGRPCPDLRLGDDGPDDAGAGQTDRRGERGHGGREPDPPGDGPASSASRRPPRTRTSWTVRRAGTWSSTRRATRRRSRTAWSGWPRRAPSSSSGWPTTRRG